MIRLTFIVPKFVLPSLEYACKIKQSNKLILNNCKNCPMQESRFAGFTKLTTVKFKQPEWISWYILSTVIWIKIVEFSSISSVWFHESESLKVWHHEIVSKPLINRYCPGSGCGSVGRSFASKSRGPRFKSSHRQNLYRTFYWQLYWKDGNKEKEAGNGPFLYKSPLPNC